MMKPSWLVFFDNWFQPTRWEVCYLPFKGTSSFFSDWQNWGRSFLFSKTWQLIFCWAKHKKTLANQLGILQSSGLPHKERKWPWKSNLSQHPCLVFFFGWCKDKDLVVFLEDGAKFLLAIADIFPKISKRWFTWIWWTFQVRNGSFSNSSDQLTLRFLVKGYIKDLYSIVIYPALWKR